jgi:hypothetical protein
MSRDELIAHGKRILIELEAGLESESEDMGVAKLKAIEFLKTFSGPASTFYVKASQETDYYVQECLAAFIQYVEAGLHRAITPEREAELELMSDYLSLAQNFLSDNKIHAATAVMVIGATLEEFLRTWVEKDALTLEGKLGLKTYADALKKADMISRQEYRDIENWGGRRNHAAHGEWDEVSDKREIRIMLEGVNLFMQKHRDV